MPSQLQKALGVLSGGTIPPECYGGVDNYGALFQAGALLLLRSLFLAGFCRALRALFSSFFFSFFLPFIASTSIRNPSYPMYLSLSLQAWSRGLGTALGGPPTQPGRDGIINGPGTPGLMVDPDEALVQEGAPVGGTLAVRLSDSPAEGEVIRVAVEAQGQPGASPVEAFPAVLEFTEEDWSTRQMVDLISGILYFEGS
jgi:hypothetical protein